jgi:hypothetical protein
LLLFSEVSKSYKLSEVFKRFAPLKSACSCLLCGCVIFYAAALSFMRLRLRLLLQKSKKSFEKSDAFNASFKDFLLFFSVPFIFSSLSISSRTLELFELGVSMDLSFQKGRSLLKGASKDFLLKITALQKLAACSCSGSKLRLELWNYSRKIRLLPKSFSATLFFYSLQKV